MEVAEILAIRRREMKVSYEELNRRTGVSENTLKKVLTGATGNPAFELVKAIAYALDLTLDELIAIQRGGIQKESVLSPAALAHAARYDRMDEHGRRVLDMLADAEEERMQISVYNELVNAYGEVHKEAIEYFLKMEAEEREKLREWLRDFPESGEISG